MAIHISPGPAKGIKIVQRNFAPVLNEMGVIDAAPRRARTRARRIDSPWPVFSSSLEDVLASNGRLLKAARRTSWQYVVFEGDRVVALAEVAHKRSLRYASQQSAELANAVLETVQKAKELATRSDYELRILRVPDLYLLAVWLHAPNSDLLIPVSPFTDVLGDGTVFTEEQAIAALKPLAQVRAATPDA